MKHLLYIVLVGLLISCGSSKVFTERENQDYQKLKELVRAKQFNIQSNFARPMASSSFSQVANSGVLGIGNSASSIDISSNSNALEIKGDSISGFFPYYGDVQIGSGYPGTNHQGIEFSGIPKDYSVTENDDKHSVQIQFEIDDRYRNLEHYKVYITLFPTNKSVIQINSTNRSSIEYAGRFQQLKEEDKK